MQTKSDLIKSLNSLSKDKDISLWDFRPYIAKNVQAQWLYAGVLTGYRIDKAGYANDVTRPLSVLNKQSLSRLFEAVNS